MRRRLSSIYHCLFLLTLYGGLSLGRVEVLRNAAAQTGAAISTSTKSGYKKSNQSKVFHHDSQWWALAYHEPDDRWYIWRYSGTVWVKTRDVDQGLNYAWDAVLNSSTGKLYLFGSHKSAPRFRRLSYAGGTWNKDSGYPVTVSGFANADEGNPVSLVRAKNGDLWIFRINTNILQAKRSTNDGLTWSATINIKTGLTTAKGTTDAVVFHSGGNDYVGVAYGETDATGSKFGFLRHRDGDPEANWTDETPSLTYFGNERGFNNLCMTTDHNNNVYLLTRNLGATGNSPRNTLYKRTNSGVWEKYKVNSTAARIWKTPAIAIDAANNKIYVMGVHISTLAAEYKSCPLGQEAALDTATVADLLSSSGASFDNLSVPAANIDTFTGLMVCGDNTTASDIWFRHLSTGATLPLVIGPVSVVSNEVNANATYTIPLTLSGNGALTAGTGIINFRFTSNTFVPDTMATSAVLIDGTPVLPGGIISNSSTRQVSITTPVNLPNNHSFAVVFNPGAGLLNPTNVGGYKLTAWTSSQQTQVYSSNYNLVQATTTVSPAAVTLGNSLPDSCTSYTIAFNLGAHGRLLSGTSTFTLTFDPATTITNGALSGVTVNGVAANATGNNTSKTVMITVPASVSLSNNAAVTLLLPASAICNPSLNNDYTLTLATSVETTPVASNSYRITGRLTIGEVLVAPAQVSVPASYTIPLTLASNGGLTAGTDTLAFRFPVGTVVPNSMTASQISVDGTPATTVTSNSATREVHLITPVNLPNSHHFSVVFNTGAGLSNPTSTGSYSLEAWSNVQPAAATSPLYTLTSESGRAIATWTKSGYRKSNQSKVFYYDGQWWALAFYEPENRWYIWRYNGTSWDRTAIVDKSITYHWDAVLNETTGKLYLFGSNNAEPEFRCYSYAGGTWNKDAGFPVALLDFPNVDQGNPVSLVQAKNGDLWIFRIINNKLQAKHSSDGGLTWSAIITLKTGLTTANGTTDAVAFTAGAHNYVGVAYGETDVPGSKYGFLMHRDGDPDGTWTDESAALTFFGSERGFNNLCMTTDPNNNVYLFTRNVGVTGDNPRNTLYKRTNTEVWEKYKVNATASLNWKTPAISIDASNGVIYVMGVNTNTLVAEYKICLIGQESALEGATVNSLFSGGTFDDLSVPAANINATSGLMVCVDNTAASDIWYRHLAIAGSLPVTVGAITVTSNEVNANATYTIPLTLSSHGALTAGTGVINFRFPDNTDVPNSMPANAVVVDGTPASSLIANSITRQVSVTTPVDLPNNHSFSVVFDSSAGAGLLNPTPVDSNYKLTVWTSAQPSQTNSPSYSLTQATTKVTPATVTPFPIDPDSLANYTLAFNLGAHGRLLSGTSTFTVKFGPATKVTHGALSGAKVNTVNATAIGDSGWRKITVTLPASVALTNQAAVTLFLPNSAIRNPSLAGDYTLTVCTSVETTAVVSNAYAIQPRNNIGAPIPGTTKRFDRNNQSKMFYHGGFWWVTAQSKTDSKWYLWKFDGTTWTQSILLHATAKDRPDCILDAANNKAYILLPGSGTTYLTRLSYSGSNWSVDSDYPYTVPGFSQNSDRGINLVRTKNGNLWVFMISDSTLIAKRSTNDGQSWSDNIIVKSNLHNADGLTDAVAFSYSGSNYVGVGYAENSGAGSVYGFLRHKINDPDTIWTPETIPQFEGTTADDHISMTVHNHKVLMIVKTNGGGPTITSVGLLHRETTGVWTKYSILLSNGWTRPTLAIDETNSQLYVIGTREGPVKVGEMKHVAIDSYSSLLSAPIDTIFKNETNEFFDVSVAAHAVNGTMNLLVCNGNETRDELWYNLITLGGAPKIKGQEPSAEALQNDDFDGVQVYPNPFNPYTTFRFKVKDAPLCGVKLQIFNINGQLVRTLVDTELPPGVYQRRWNGRGKNGYPAASGIYFYRLQIGQKMMAGRIQMIK